MGEAEFWDRQAATLRADLLVDFLPFWTKFGVDTEHGGFMCSLGDRGELVDGTKFTW
jgi:mannose/cellobiose epimerase-like protein (N-acyl-D-glucosamine 2-epimerase family)